MSMSARDAVMFEARFDASLNSERPITVEPAGGIVLLAVGRNADSDQVPVVLVVDLAGLDGGRNDGASATNAMDSIVSHWRGSVAATFACPQGRPVWVQVDSMGRFDIVDPTIFPGGSVHIDWRPLRSLSGRNAPSSRAAFAELFPGVAVLLLERLDSLRSGFAEAEWPRDRSRPS